MTPRDHIDAALQRVGHIRACIEAAQTLEPGDATNRLTDCAAQICEDLEQELERQLQSEDSNGGAA